MKADDDRIGNVDTVTSDNRAATDDSRYLTFSVTKAVVAAAVWLAIADGALRPETRVCEHVPSFARPGFDAAR